MRSSIKIILTIDVAKLVGALLMFMLLTH